MKLQLPVIVIIGCVGTGVAQDAAPPARAKAAAESKVAPVEPGPTGQRVRNFRLSRDRLMGDGALVFEIRLADTIPSDTYTRPAQLDSGGKLYLHKDALLTLGDIAGVKFIRRPDRGTDLQLDIESDGSGRLTVATQQNVGKKLAVVLDGEVVAAARIAQQIPADVSVTATFSDTTLSRLFTALVLAKPHPQSTQPLAPVSEVGQPLEIGP